MVIDWLGGVFSTLSLVFKEKFDVIAGVTYSLVIVSNPLASSTLRRRFIVVPANDFSLSLVIRRHRLNTCSDPQPKS